MSVADEYKRREERAQVAADFGLRAPRSICLCGHSGDGAWSEHAPWKRPPGSQEDDGHGACKVPGCGCRFFCWSHWTDIFRAALARVDQLDQPIPYKVK